MEGIRSALPKDVRVFVAVKANAYGHGDVHVSKAALEAGAHGLAVATLDEAIRLRKSGLDAPILLMGTSRPSDAGIAAELRISLAVFQTEWIQEAASHIKEGQKLRIHIKCDTGMGRLGIKKTEELKEIQAILKQSGKFHTEGIFTHFATADQVSSDYYLKQVMRFEEMVEQLEDKPEYIHAANSASALCHGNALFNTVRIGISLYGLAPSEEVKPLLPYERKEAFSLHTKVSHVKKLEAGESIGYGATYTASQEEWIATVPIGYADGWIRKLQGIEVVAGGGKAKVVGRICMDQMMLRLPCHMPIGTDVTLIGRQGDQFVPVDEIADYLDTINYEVTCMIPARVPRVYKKSGKTLGIDNPVLCRTFLKKMS